MVGLAGQQRPDLVVLSGDITQRARSAQFRAARAFVDRLEAPVLAIPGNHDIALFDLWSRLVRPFARHAAAFGQVLEPVHATDDLLVIGVNTTRPWRHKNGEVSYAQVERVATLRNAMGQAMEAGVGIFRQASGMQATCDALAELRARWRAGVRLDDRRRVFNTEWLSAIELGGMLEVAETMAHAALARQESRGAHVRLDGFGQRDDARFLVHSLARHGGDGPPAIGQAPVVITRSPPQARSYGGAGQKVALT